MVVILTGRLSGQRRLPGSVEARKVLKRCGSTASKKSSRWQMGHSQCKARKLSYCSPPSLHTILLHCAPAAAMAMAMTTLPLQAHEICPCSCSYSSQISTSLASTSAVRTAGIFRLRTPKVWSVGVGHGARAMAPDEEKMTRRSPLDFPVVRPLSKSSPFFLFLIRCKQDNTLFCELVSETPKVLALNMEYVMCCEFSVEASPCNASLL